MKIVLDLKKHCIQTEIKKQYERCIRDYFSKHHAPEDESVLDIKIEALKFFLEHADFPRLRGQYPELNGSHEITVLLDIADDFYNIKIMTDDHEIHPEWQDGK